MVLGLLLSLAGCRTFSLSEEELTELEEDEAQVVVGQSTVQTIGQELAATYAADHIFSLNCVSDTTYNPFLTSSAWNKVVGMLVYETLVEQDEGFSAQPNLITSWKTEDGLTWTFTVDTTRTFHDGGRMTSLDAAYSLQLAMNYEGAYNTRFRHVQDVYWDGEEVLNVVLRTPDYQFYQLMNIPCVEYETGFQDRPPGTGPYKFSASGRYLTLVKDHPLADRMPRNTPRRWISCRPSRTPTSTWSSTIPTACPAWAIPIPILLNMSIPPVCTTWHTTCPARSSVKCPTASS